MKLVVSTLTPSPSLAVVVSSLLLVCGLNCVLCVSLDRPSYSAVESDLEVIVRVTLDAGEMFVSLKTSNGTALGEFMRR